MLSGFENLARGVARRDTACVGKVLAFEPHCHVSDLVLLPISLKYLFRTSKLVSRRVSQRLLCHAFLLEQRSHRAVGHVRVEQGLISWHSVDFGEFGFG